MAKVELKQPIVQAISECVKDAKAIIVVDYRGLTVEQDTALRREMRDAGVTYKVFKNTMMRRAFEGTDFAQLNDYLEGPSAIAISNDDVTAPARVLFKNMKDMKKLEVKGGVVEGGLLDVAGVKELAEIPGREVLISRLLGSMQSPIANLARVIDQIAENGGAPAEEAAPAAEEAPAEEAAPAAEEAPAEAPAAE